MARVVRNPMKIVKHTWEFSDGTTARWEGAGSVVVVGDSSVADGIRTMLRLVAEAPIRIYAARAPGNSVNLDLTSIWLVDRMLKTEAARLGVALVSSTYSPRDEDMNAETARIVLRDRKIDMSNDPPGRVY